MNENKKTFEEMQTAAYTFTRNKFIAVLRWQKKKHEEPEKPVYRDLETQALSEYSAACDLYETVFDSEFMLNNDDRKSLSEKYNIALGYYEEIDDENTRIVLAE